MDERPPVWIGHVVLTVSDIERAMTFWEAIGMRAVDRGERVAILEMRGGTHLILVPGEPNTMADAPFDLMVDDVEATHADWDARGLRVGPLERGTIHTSFDVRDPDGYAFSVNSSHVIGPV